MKTLDQRNARRHDYLEEMNAWRNAIAHQDFDPAKLGARTTVRLVVVQQWHSSCDALAGTFDEVMRVYLSTIVGASPW